MSIFNITENDESRSLLENVQKKKGALVEVQTYQKIKNVNELKKTGQGKETLLKNENTEVKVLNNIGDNTKTKSNQQEAGNEVHSFKGSKKAEGKAFCTSIAIGTTTATGTIGTNCSDEVETKFKFESKAEVRATIQTDKEGIYRIQDSGNGNSWLIGTDVYSAVEDAANGFVLGTSGCTSVLEIPGTLKDKEGSTKPVEIIGRGAFAWCGCSGCSPGGLTKILKVPRQVKVVKYLGLGWMHDLVSFEIEAGSELQTIEDWGLHRIGFNTGRTPSKRNTTLILPSTLSSVYYEGILYCNLFHTVIYCGSHSLTKSSELEYSVSPDTVVKVTNRYPSGSQIFKRTPSRTEDSEAEAERLCQDFLGQPTPNPPTKPVFQRGFTPLLATTFFNPSLSLKKKT